jgi:Uma2 family endonuclease
MEERFILYDVSWQTYQSLLADHTDRRAPRFTFNNGTLEMVRMSAIHEYISCTIDRFIETVCDESRFEDWKPLGCVTHIREDLQQGFEPDSCYYIQNVKAIKGIKDFDLNTHPPPDLIVEVDISKPMLDKIAIFAAFGVPEVWHYQTDEIKFFRLEENNYVKISESIALAKVTPTIANRFIHESQTMSYPEWVRNVREWARLL